MGGGGGIWSMYIILFYESRTVKPIEIVLSRGEGMRENDGGGAL
jgi:hypothetical protein